MTLGVAVELGSVTVGADVGLIWTPGNFDRLDGTEDVSTLTEGQNPANVQQDVVREVERKMVVNASLGVEYRVNETWCLRAGAFTDFSATSLDDLERVRIATEKVDRFGGTLGLGIDLGGAETSLAIGYIGGFGEVVGFDVGNFDNRLGLRTVDAVQSIFVAMLSGTVDLKSFLGGG